MLTMPVAISETEYDLFIVMTKKNVDRVMDHDPMLIDISKYSKFMERSIKDIHVFFANAEEVAELQRARGKSLEEVLEMIIRLGRWKYHPGDGPVPILGLNQN